MSKIDYLTEDTIIPDNQKFVCISFLSDKDNKISLTGVKIRGIFTTYDEACEHAKKVQSVDPYFNVFVGEMGKWLPYDPNPESEYIKNSEYANEELNNMMKKYMENQEKAKLFHEQRKNDLVRQNIVDNLNIRKENLEDLNKKLNESDNDNDKNNIELNIKNIEEQISKMEEKKKEVEEELETLNNKIKNI